MKSSETPAPRGRPRSRTTERRILEATRALLLSGGYARLTMEGVASKAGASKATVYRWWPTRGELVLDAAKDEISIGTVPDTGDTRHDIAAAIDQLVETFSRPLAKIVIFAAITPSGDDPRLATLFRERYVYPWRVSAAQALERGAARGELARDDVAFLLDMIVGTVFQRTSVVKEPQTEGLRDQLLGVVFGPG